jgi:hypothetical protein
MQPHPNLVLQLRSDPLAVLPGPHNQRPTAVFELIEPLPYCLLPFLERSDVGGFGTHGPAVEDASFVELGCGDSELKYELGIVESYEGIASFYHGAWGGNDFGDIPRAFIDHYCI